MNDNIIKIKRALISVFDKTDIQKQIQEYEEIKNSNLTEKGKNIEAPIDNIINHSTRAPF